MEDVVSFALLAFSSCFAQTNGNVACPPPPSRCTTLGPPRETKESSDERFSMADNNTDNPLESVLLAAFRRCEANETGNLCRTPSESSTVFSRDESNPKLLPVSSSRCTTATTTTATSPLCPLCDPEMMRERVEKIIALMQRGAGQVPLVRGWLWNKYGSIPSSGLLLSCVANSAVESEGQNCIVPQAATTSRLLQGLVDAAPPLSALPPLLALYVITHDQRRRQEWLEALVSSSDTLLDDEKVEGTLERESWSRRAPRSLPFTTKTSSWCVLRGLGLYWSPREAEVIQRCFVVPLLSAAHDNVRGREQGTGGQSGTALHHDNNPSRPAARLGWTDPSTEEEVDEERNQTTESGEDGTLWCASHLSDGLVGSLSFFLFDELYRRCGIVGRREDTRDSIGPMTMETSCVLESCLMFMEERVLPRPGCDDDDDGDNPHSLSLNQTVGYDIPSEDVGDLVTSSASPTEGAAAAAGYWTSLLKAVVWGGDDGSCQTHIPVQGSITSYTRVVLQPVDPFLLCPSLRESPLRTWCNVRFQSAQRQSPNTRSNAPETTQVVFLPTFQSVLEDLETVLFPVRWAGFECNGHLVGNETGWGDSVEEAVPPKQRPLLSEGGNHVSHCASLLAPNNSHNCSEGGQIKRSISAALRDRGRRVPSAVIVAVAFRSPLGQLVLLEQWWRLSVTALLADEVKERDADADNDFAALTDEREDQWQLRVTALFESFRCSQLGGIKAFASFEGAPVWESKQEKRSVTRHEDKIASEDWTAKSTAPERASNLGFSRGPEAPPPSIMDPPAVVPPASVRQGRVLSLGLGLKRPRETPPVPDKSPKVPHDSAVMSSPWWTTRHHPREGGADPQVHAGCSVCFHPGKYMGLQEEMQEAEKMVPERQERIIAGRGITLVKKEGEVPVRHLPLLNTDFVPKPHSSTGSTAERMKVPLSAWILDVQTAVTREYTDLLASAVADRRAAEELGGSAGSQPSRRKLKLLLTPAYTSAVKRVTDALSQYASHKDGEASACRQLDCTGEAIHPLKLSSKACVSEGCSASYLLFTVTAVGATCGAFCSFSVCRWLVEGVVQMSRCCSGEQDCMNTNPMHKEEVGEQSPVASHSSSLHLLAQRLVCCLCGGESELEPGACVVPRPPPFSSSRMAPYISPSSPRREDVEFVVRWLQQCHFIARSLFTSWGPEWCFLMRYRPITKGILPCLVREIREWGTISNNDKNSENGGGENKKPLTALREELSTALDHLNSLFL